MDETKERYINFLDNIFFKDINDSREVIKKGLPIGKIEELMHNYKSIDMRLRGLPGEIMKSVNPSLRERIIKYIDEQSKLSEIVTFTELLKNLMKTFDISISRIAKETDVDQSYLSLFIKPDGEFGSEKKAELMRDKNYKEIIADLLNSFNINIRRWILLMNCYKLDEPSLKANGITNVTVVAFGSVAKSNADYGSLESSHSDLEQIRFLTEELKDRGYSHLL